MPDPVEVRPIAGIGELALKVRDSLRQRFDCGLVGTQTAPCWIRHQEPQGAEKLGVAPLEADSVEVLALVPHLAVGAIALARFQIDNVWRMSPRAEEPSIGNPLDVEVYSAGKP